LPQNFRGELRPYQKAGYNWLHFLKKYKFGGCLADDMGLGKTVQTLAFLQSLQNEDKTNSSPSLLIVPTSLIYNWQIEAQKFTPDLKILVYAGHQRVKDEKTFQHYDLVITSYGVVRQDEDLFLKFYFKYIILDESQVIKNPSSAISKTVRMLKSHYKLILTGTPIENSTLDLWTQISFINPGLLGTQNYFKDHFLTPIEKHGSEEKMRKLQAMIKPFVLRRLKTQVATDLPDKIENIRYTHMTPEQEKLYEETKSYFRNQLLEDYNGENQLLLIQGLTKLRQIANHPKLVDSDCEVASGKLDDVLYMIDEIISEKHKILIFSQFVKYLDLFRNKLDDKKIAYRYIDGSISSKDRQAEVSAFQNNEETKVFLISLKAGGVGLNLTAADYVFILDPWWNPAIENQAIDRAHRIGQKNTVFTYKFITKNTVEEKILLLQEKKKLLAGNLIKSEESFVKSLTKEDIKMILE
jgi:SNF2 family DNA or RNA helicase